MIDRHQLAHIINNLIVNYNNNQNIERFYRKINRLTRNIAIYTKYAIFDEFKITLKCIHKNMINGEDDVTIVNDCIYVLRKISINLLIFI